MSDTVDTTETVAEHAVHGSNRLLTLLVLGFLGSAVLIWSLILPVIGVLYLLGHLS